MTCDKNNSQSSVRFYEYVTVRPVMSRDEYTTQEVADCWFNAEECKAIAQKASHILGLMQSQAAKNYCTRGLERCGGKALDRKKQRRQRAYEIVRSTSSSEEQIAQALHEISSRCEQEARRVAVKDQAHAGHKQKESTSFQPKATCTKRMLIPSRVSSMYTPVAGRRFAPCADIA